MFLSLPAVGAACFQVSGFRGGVRCGFRFQLWDIPGLRVSIDIMHLGSRPGCVFSEPFYAILGFGAACFQVSGLRGSVFGVAGFRSAGFRAAGLHCCVVCALQGCVAALSRRPLQICRPLSDFRLRPVRLRTALRGLSRIM